MMYCTISVHLTHGIYIIKFVYSKKATKFCKISTLLLSTVHTDKSKVEILKHFVAFSEYMNFTDKKACQLKQSEETREEIEDKNKTCLKLLETQSNLLKLWFLVVT